MTDRLLVVAGEASGDRALAGIVRALGLRTFGLGGDALMREGVELVAHVKDLGGMGLVEAAGRAPTIASALGRLAAAIARIRPRLALLASWSATNARLASVLHHAGVRVAWISPPEIWAWRASRARKIARNVDLLVPTLPFEEALWRAAGGNAHFVGHPVVDVPLEERPREGLAILPGSRPSEIERLLSVFVEAAQRSGLPARMILAPSLDEATRERVLSAGLPVLEARDGAAPLLSSFSVALVASGTAALEAAAMGTPPVIAYAMHPLSFAIARRVVKIDHVGLPNVLLGRSGHAAVFPERLQQHATAELLARDILEIGEHHRAACTTVRSLLGPPGFSERAAALVERLVR